MFFILINQNSIHDIGIEVFRFHIYAVKFFLFFLVYYNLDVRITNFISTLELSNCHENIK